MRIDGSPFHFHSYRKRVCARERTGSWSDAAFQVRPPSVLTSTCRIFPAPVHAIPPISFQPRSIVFGYAGLVMSERASIAKLNMRAVPLANGSVYFDVSSRVMKGLSDSSMRRSHFTFVLPSHPGRKRRAG